MVASSAELFVSEPFDFLIVGGGTAGLVVAKRLAEDPAVRVGVLDAGEVAANESGVNIPGLFITTLNNPKFDWMYKSVPQAALNNREIPWPRGKVVGGTSAINLLAWETLGNADWNWDTLLNYFKKSESVRPPDPAMVAEYGGPSLDSAHGTSGPMKKSYPKWLGGPILPFFKTLNALGIPTNHNPEGGSNLGVSVALNAIDPETMSRSYAYSSYYAPDAERPNLVLLTGAHVTKVVFENDNEQPLKAIGVDFVDVATQTKMTVKARKEVILSAGAVITPQILELSGIGEKEVLESAGIPLVLELPVGENLQDHVYIPSSYELRPEVETRDKLRDPAELGKAMRAYTTKKEGPMSTGPAAFSFLPLHVAANEITIKELTSSAATTKSARTRFAKQYDLLEKWLVDPNHAQIELAPAAVYFTLAAGPPKAGTPYFSILSNLPHPFSRGSVHIKSANPFEHPAIDPAYLQEEIDLRILLSGLKFAGKVAASSPLSSLVVSRTHPAPDTSDEDLIRYIKNYMMPVNHPIGTASMLPKEDGGVVDAQLCVYGTSNLRVVDASVIPLHISHHPQDTIYAIAEKASDIIKAAHVA